MLAEPNASSEQQEGELPASLVPVTVLAEKPIPHSAPSATAEEGEIEIRLGKAQIRIRGAADPSTLQLILASLRG